MVVRLNSHPSNFAYKGADVFMPGVCVGNQFHGYLMGKGVELDRIFKFNCPHPYPLIASNDVSSLGLEGYPIDSWIAKWQAAFLAKEGILLSVGFVHDHRDSLVSSYLLSSCLCVAEVKSGGQWEYILATKSPEILMAHESRLTPAARSKGFDRFSEQLSTSYKELSSVSYSAVRMFADVDGIILSKRTLGTSSSKHLFPYYAVNRFALRIKDILSNQKVRLTFRDAEGLRPPLVTTLNTAVVSAWLGTSSSNAELAKWADWSSSASMGYMSLPDLSQRGQFVSVPILHIEKIERC